MLQIAQEGFMRTDFAGPGGSSLGLKMLGLNDVGVEYEESAVSTARYAGHKRWLADVRQVRDFRWPTLWGYCASPECQSFSMAGKGEGREQLMALMAAARFVIETATPEEAFALTSAERPNLSALLSLEPLYVIATRLPTWVVLEQVPGVQPLWDVYAELMPELGYSVATGILNAEQYGVPQTRRRAILVAHLEREAHLPTPTHSRYYSRSPKKLDEGVLPWVSMAEALGWGMIERPSMTVTGGGTGAGGAEPFGNGARQSMLREIEEGRFVQRSNYSQGSSDGRTAEERGRTIRELDHPSVAITGKGFQWQYLGAGPGSQERVGLRPREMDEPAHTVTGARSAYWVPDGPPLEAVKAMGSGMVERYGDRPGRSIDQPAFTVRANAGGMEPGGFRWSDPEAVAAYREGVASEVEGRVNNQSGTAFDLAWPADRPSPVIAGRELVTMPGANANRFNGSSKSRNDGIRVTVQEAGVLQSFPADYPWQGTKTQQFQQVGNAVPPLLQAAIVAGLLGG